MDILLTTITVVLFTVVVVVGIWTVCILIINHNLGRELKRMSDEIDKENEREEGEARWEKLACKDDGGTEVFITPIGRNQDECSHGVRPLTKEAKKAMKTRKHK